MILPIAFWLTALLAFPNEHLPVHKANYCNSLFKFCVTYPASLLPQQSSPDSADSGVVLKTATGDAVVAAEGVANPGRLAPDEILAEAIRSMTASGEAPMIVSTLPAEDFYQAFFLHAGKSIFHKAYLFDGYFVRLTITVPVNRPELMQRLREDVDLEFGAYGG